MDQLIQVSTLAFILVASFQAPAAQPSAIDVCATCEVKTLKGAIAISSAGGIIRVGPGVYQEDDLVIDKPLKLRAIPGRERPVIDARNKANGLVIKADDVEVSGFLIKNSGLSYTEEMAGIKVLKSARCLLKDNQLENNAFGIYIADSKSCVVSGNRVQGTLLSEVQSGNGIHIWKGEGFTIEDNELVGNRDGIYFEFVHNSSIKKNRSLGNMRYGLHFMFSHNNDYRENVFRDNDCGVAVMYSRNIQMYRNRFEHSRGPVSYGILLKEISDSDVGANLFLDNTIGLFVDGTTRTNFEGNVFQNNGWAIRILGDTDSNKFIRNDFINNTFDVSTNTTSNQNEFARNYWSRYKGLDLNKDGYGDDPFRPVQLSSMLMEHYPVGILLIHSVFFSILDQVENVLPVLTPEAFKDDQPRMTRASVL